MRTLRCVVQIFHLLLASNNYKCSHVNLAQILTPVKVRSKPSTCVRNRKDLKPKLVEQLKTQFRAFVGVNTEANRSMLPRFKTKSTKINNHMYIEQNKRNLAKKFNNFKRAHAAICRANLS